MPADRLFVATDKYDGLGVKFYFHARDLVDARRKLNKWNRRHSFADSPGWGWHKAEPVNRLQVIPPDWVHDEYL